MNLREIQRAFFIGIGGIGMSALARHFRHVGIDVYGYDRTKTNLTTQLEEEGMQVHYMDDLTLIPDNVDLVVYTPAIPQDHKQLNYFLAEGYTVMKRSQVLGDLSEDQLTIAIAGSHGKTTVTAMVAHILHHSGYGCTAFLGGIAANYNTNYIASDNNVMVVEADEFDRSFLQLHPNIGVITAVDTDHLDIYGSKENIQKAFLEFAARIEPGGQLFMNSQAGILPSVSKNTNITSYHISNEQAPYCAQNVKVEDGKYLFSIKGKPSFTGCELSMGGRYNIENALVAIAVAQHLEIEEDKIKNSLASFKGIKRRFEVVYSDSDTTYIDDYAHHPKEIEALLAGVRELYPGKKVIIIFQPHLYSRTRDLAEEFAKALSKADEVFLLPIYPAREKPIPEVSSELILEPITVQQKQIIEPETVLAALPEIKPEVLLTVGAGDIDQLVEPIKTYLQKS